MDKEAAEAEGLSINAYLARKAQRRHEDESAALFSLQRSRRLARTKIDQEMARRRTFGWSLGIPIAAHLGKIISSRGVHTRNQTPRIHVVLDEPLDTGYMVRRRGDLLCQPYKKLGRCVITGNDLLSKDAHKAVEGEITCKTCLKFLRSHQKTGPEAGS